MFFEYLFVSTTLVVCLWVKWFPQACFFLECIFILFYLTKLKLCPAKTCFISMINYYNLFISPECTSQYLSDLHLSIVRPESQQYCYSHKVYTVLIGPAYGRSSPDLSFFSDWLQLLLYLSACYVNINSSL